MKFLEITTDKARYELPLRVVAGNRASYYKKEKGADYTEAYNFVMTDDYEGEDWFKNNMNENEFMDELVLIERFEDEDFPNAEIEIIDK